MAENLNVGKMIISTSGGQPQTDNDTIEKYCYSNNEDSCDVYGGLYEWNEAMQYILVQGTKGICPTDWHLPDWTEWNALGSFLGGLTYAGAKMKEAGLAHWNTPNTDATNESGFTALPGGYRSYTDGTFWLRSFMGYFWISSQYDATRAYWSLLYCDQAYLGIGDVEMDLGISVRCLKDE
jgi:uncharacterized protein (TIGR02145 family)